MTHLVMLAALGEGRYNVEWYDYFFLLGAGCVVLGIYGLFCSLRLPSGRLAQVRGSLDLVVIGVGNSLVFYGWFVLGSLLILIGLIDVIMRFRQQRL